MARPVQWLLGTLIFTILIAAPLAYVSYLNKNFRNFQVVNDGVLYRSGQMSGAGLKAMVREHGIRTVVTLRDAAVPGGLPPDAGEEAYCRKEEMNHFRLTPRPWWAPDNTVPAEENVRRFLEIMDDPKNHPVLIHCFAGSHRTGAYCAIYRMEYEHWSNKEALEEMRAYGYVNIDDEWDILDYLEKYQPRWKDQARSRVAQPDKQTTDEHRLGIE
ncbi:MAG: dual specificity protein phosphatase family protein [Gemmataceae bacterium]|nr:dual specificity protein phosphatase family protein [Gemmataceae bacterium]